MQVRRDFLRTNTWCVLCSVLLRKNFQILRFLIKRNFIFFKNPTIKILLNNRDKTFSGLSGVLLEPQCVFCFTNLVFGCTYIHYHFNLWKRISYTISDQISYCSLKRHSYTSFLDPLTVELIHNEYYTTRTKQIKKKSGVRSLYVV